MNVAQHLAQSNLRSAATALSTAALLLGASPSLASTAFQQGGGNPQPSVDAAMQTLQGKYLTKEKKYESLAIKIDKGVAAALAAAQWNPAGDAGAPRGLMAHPQLARAHELAAGLGGSKRPSSEVAALLEVYPWREKLELVDGLQFGSDRAIPANENGFIEMGTTPTPCPGFPQLSLNTYLWGLGEVVGWSYRVEDRKGVRFLGRGPKDGPEPLTQMPGWERVRVYLLGLQPETALLGLHGLTHEIHRRGVERRKPATDRLGDMDRLSVLLDSRWNGFLVKMPHAAERLAIVQPVHTLLADPGGFLYGFAPSARMAKVGDLPFISVTTQVTYGNDFMGVTITPENLIGRSADAERVVDRFWQDCTYLSRYKLLIDEIVRAALTPHLPFPQYLAAYDFANGALPAADAPDTAFDVPRGHALLVWAWAGGDPARVADFLHDELLDKEANRFPSKVSLQILFTTLVRERSDELLEVIAEHVNSERVERGPGAEPGDFELQFSPYPELGGDGAPALRHLVRRYHAWHEPLSRTIEEAAWKVVQDEL